MQRGSPKPIGAKGLKRVIRRTPGRTMLLGLTYLRKGQFTEAEAHFARAVRRLTVRNPNPDHGGAAFYNLGVARKYLGKTLTGLMTPSIRPYGILRGSVPDISLWHRSAPSAATCAWHWSRSSAACAQTL